MTNILLPQKGKSTNKSHLFDDQLQYLKHANKCMLFLQVDEPPFRPVLTINDMTHMAKFVYDFYKVKVDHLMKLHGVSRDLCLFIRSTLD